MESSRTTSTHQSKRTSDYLEDDPDTSSQKDYNKDILRQYDDNLICQQVWGGGTRSTPLMNLARQIWNVCLKTNTQFHLTYMASPFNPGDGPSRRLMTQLKWRIAPSYFRHLERKWGPHSLDLFASHLNHQLTRYVSWQWDPRGLATDTMKISWPNLSRLYMYQPWNLPPSVAALFQQEKINTTLITPWWPPAIWFPTLRALAQPRPFKVPRTIVFPAVGQNASVLQENPHWSLSAWNIKFEELRQLTQTTT
jgi:hypothetical protein